MKLALPGGQSAVLRERLTYAQARDVRVAFLAIQGNRGAMADLDMALTRAYVDSWNVLDLEGNAVPLDTPELAPDDAIQAISIAAIDIWKGTGVPKAGRKTSPTTLRVAG